MTDDLGFHVVENPVHVHDLQATILDCLGFDHEKLTEPLDRDNLSNKPLTVQVSGGLVLVIAFCWQRLQTRVRRANSMSHRSTNSGQRGIPVE